MKQLNRTSGVIKGPGNIAYAFDFPSLLVTEETQNFLQDLSRNFLSFLKKQSESPCDFVRFGGLLFEEKDRTLTLFSAFCPFEEREYRPVATIQLDKDGTILRIRREKRPRRKS